MDLYHGIYSSIQKTTFYFKKFGGYVFVSERLRFSLDQFSLMIPLFTDHLQEKQNTHK